MASFGFFYSTSSTLVDLLERTELFAVSQTIKNQLVEALADLVSLVAGVSTHFHQSIYALSEGSISINIYETFTGQIESFRERCAKISESMWRHQLVQESKDPENGKNILHPLSIGNIRMILTIFDYVQCPLLSSSEPGCLPRTASSATSPRTPPTLPTNARR